MLLRIYLAGHLTIEAGPVQLDESELPARQGRLAFAYLVMQRRRDVPRAELAQAIWNEDLPQAWDGGLSALLSRLRRLFRTAPLDLTIETLSGTVSLGAPGDTWVDLDVARNALDDAEGALRSGNFRDAWSNGVVAHSITERGFLTGEELPWVVEERTRLQEDHVRVLECLAEVSLALDEPATAVRYARRLTEIEPFRESAYEREMRAQLKLGNRAEALRVYDRLRRLLADELGADPSPALEAAYLEALRA